MKKFNTFIVILFFFLINNTFAQFQLQNAFPNLSFNYPIGIYHSNDGRDKLFVVEETGVIKVFENNRFTTISKTFLDISDRVYFNGGECGLLGLAFHPQYKSNRYFYVDYIANNPLRTIIARYQVSQNNPDSAIESSEEILMTIPQPYNIHNGGQLAFGADGFLYIGMGDGGPEGDPNNNAQNLQLLLGKILRIDIDNPSNGMNYGIPADNPFYQNASGYREEIYAYGLRNPWRFSFDSATGLLWCGDVGQNTWEEIDLIQNGKNYGWRCYEGFHSYDQTNCSGNNYTFPVLEYEHTNGNCCIIGGFVYHGKRRPELSGKYIYGDYCTGNVWQFFLSDSSNKTIQTAPSQIYSFGTDINNELYITASDKNIYEFIPAIEAPSDLLASKLNDGKVNLTWNDNSDNENGYIIQRKNSNNIFITIDTTAGNQTSYTDLVPSSDNYVYRVIAFNDSAVSDYSNESSIAVTGIKNEISSSSNLNFKLLQNYPNPFNPSTKINYTIFKTSHVILKIYDMMGEEVSTLVNNELQPGNYSAVFKAGNLASGIYFYQLRAGNFAARKKMILLR